MVLFELIVSDNLKMNGRNYFRFYLCHSCEGTILDLQMAIFGVKMMCSQWDTIDNVVTVIKHKGSNFCQNDVQDSSGDIVSSCE